ncbi:ABC transporter ATP-binding protein [uncultured Clostridium sp.]|uniref:ABC transporter ATP-binding protein n=1 Tax=uncultured Clostridium sp. TaxID=59620 RepID=UPI0028EEE9CE|nr:ABC transporter ATP-binding protein [uncultured Clostridium sp.]
MKEKTPFIKMENISKTFGKVVANNNINFSVYGGEVHALLGENGAGKSTLMNMLSGVYTPDSGSIYIQGKKVQFTSPIDAIHSGIGMIYQHFKLVDNMSGEENIILGQKNSIFVSWKSIRNKINDICSKYDINIDLTKKVQDMSVGEKQIIEILKVLYRGANILVLDEPTTVFTPVEVEKLFNIINKMKENGCAVIFISHKMEEVMSICDKITVLRKGEVITTIEKKEANPKILATLMVGEEIELSIKKDKIKRGKEILNIKNLSLYNEDKIEVLKNISFSIQAGEVVGIAGIAGSGQKELCEAIAGITPVKNGEIIVDNENIIGKTPREIINKGVSMSFIPEDRLGMGLVGSMDMVDNLLLKSYHHQKGLLINKKETVDKANQIKEELDIRTPDIYHPIKNLSGGNIQKILLGRELDMNPSLLIMAYPVRGLDINTCYTIYNLINDQKKRGVGVLYIGEDLDVLIQLCDRILVMCNGEIKGELMSFEATKEKIGLLMGGATIEREEIKVV